MSINPFKLKLAKSKLAAAGVDVGSEVKTIRKIDSTWGSNSSASHVGTVISLDDWIRVDPKRSNDGYLFMPITMIDAIEVIS